MSRYFFHLRTADRRELTDDLGSDLADDTAAELEAVESVLELTWNARSKWRGACFEVHRGDQHLVTVWFDEVLAVGVLAPINPDHHL